jgi:O-antigen/teichoic acid export membrane protein
MIIKTLKEKLLLISKVDRQLYTTIFTNYCAKGISLLTNIIVVPLLLNYLGSDKYGFLITLLTILNWIFIFDFGIVNSVKNLTSESIGKNNLVEIGKIFSNAAFLLILILVVASTLCILIIPIGNWQSFFKIKDIPEVQLNLILISSAILFLLNMFLSLGSNMYYGLQKGYIPNIFNAIGSVISLAGIYLSVKFELSILLIIIIYLSGFVIGNFLSFTFLVVIKRLVNFSYKLIHRSTLKDIFRLGTQFLGVSLISVIIYTADNVLITQKLGPGQIALFNPIFRLNQFVLQANGLYVMALWPAYTNAIVKNDFEWIKNKFRNSLKIICVIFIPPILILMFFGPQIVRFWLGNNNIPSLSLCFTMGIWTILFLFNQSFAMLLNGAGIMGQQIKFGILTIIIFGITVFPLMENFGLVGLSLAGIISSCVGMIVNPYLIIKYFKLKDKGTIAIEK